MEGWDWKNWERCVLYDPTLEAAGEKAATKIGTAFNGADAVLAEARFWQRGVSTFQGLGPDRFHGWKSSGRTGVGIGDGTSTPA